MAQKSEIVKKGRDRGIMIGKKIYVVCRRERKSVRPKMK